MSSFSSDISPFGPLFGPTPFNQAPTGPVHPINRGPLVGSPLHSTVQLATIQASLAIKNSTDEKARDCAQSTLSTTASCSQETTPSSPSTDAKQVTNETQLDPLTAIDTKSVMKWDTFKEAFPKYSENTFTENEFNRFFHGLIPLFFEKEANAVFPEHFSSSTSCRLLQINLEGRSPLTLEMEMMVSANSEEKGGHLVFKDPSEPEKNIIEYQFKSYKNEELYEIFQQKMCRLETVVRGEKGALCHSVIAPLLFGPTCIFLVSDSASYSANQVSTIWLEGVNLVQPMIKMNKSSSQRFSSTTSSSTTRSVKWQAKL